MKKSLLSVNRTIVANIGSYDLFDHHCYRSIIGALAHLLDLEVVSINVDKRFKIVHPKYEIVYGIIVGG